MYRELEEPRDPIRAGADEDTPSPGECFCACGEPAPDAETKAAPGAKSANWLDVKLNIG